MSNVFNAGALQRAFFKIVIALFSLVSHWTLMSFRKIPNRGPGTIPYWGIHIRFYVHSPKNPLHLVQFSQQCWFHTLSTFDAWGHLPASSQTNWSIFTLFQYMSDFSTEIVASALSKSASTLSKFWRYSIRKLGTPGSPSTSSYLYWLSERSTSTSSLKICAINPRWCLVFSGILRQMPILNRYLPVPVWLADTCLG